MTGDLVDLFMKQLPKKLPFSTDTKQSIHGPLIDKKMPKGLESYKLYLIPLYRIVASVTGPHRSTHEAAAKKISFSNVQKIVHSQP